MQPEPPPRKASLMPEPTLSEQAAKMRCVIESWPAQIAAIQRDMDEIERRWRAEEQRLRAKAQALGLLPREEKR